MESFDQELQKAFGADTDGVVVRELAMAVSLADDLRRNNPWLTSALGDDLTGQLRRVAAMHRFAQACRDGQLPFAAEEIENTTGSCHLLSIRSGPFEAHLVRTESAKAFPKDAPIRQDRRVTNEPDLFTSDKIVPIREVMYDVVRLYAWLTFNANPVGMLTHVGWLMPDASTNTILGYRDVLRSAARVEAKPADPAPPKPNPGDKMKFRDAVEKIVDENKIDKK